MLTIFSVLSETVATVSLSAPRARRRPLSTCQCVILRTDKTRPSKLIMCFNRDYEIYDRTNNFWVSVVHAISVNFC